MTVEATGFLINTESAPPSKLVNQNFITKAPATIIQKEQTRPADLQTTQTKPPKPNQPPAYNIYSRNSNRHKPMHTIHNQITIAVAAWVAQQKNHNQSLIKNLLAHIESAGKLRPPQRLAIETYLWIKFVGDNKKLVEIVASGLLHDEENAQGYEYHRVFSGNYVTQFLNQFFQDNAQPKLQKKLLDDPNGAETNWYELLEELLHDFAYPNYLYSLPMGAGKTFLMACFIYIDLYFATLFGKDKRFAHNFVVFAPTSSKTAIMPSLTTIKDFNPEWILPASEAKKLKQIINIEILDSLATLRKDKLHGNNPNLEKINRLTQSKNFAMVFITNAEKVILEKYSDREAEYLDAERIFHNPKKADEVKKTNALRAALSNLPQLMVILDEVHHAYASNQAHEKKLRRAVNILNQHGHVNSVLGLSGTPYVTTTVEAGGGSIRMRQIQDIVYHYRLNEGLGKFLKTPQIKGMEAKESAFLKHALSDFFGHYDKQYANGAASKIAFYCPSIENLNTEILPVILAWYGEHRPGHEDEIFRYYSKSTTDSKKYALPKDSLAVFNNLDKPYSKKRVILLVAIGAEGWDCRSLTSVVLPRKETTKNFVLQTTCRCLREVDDAATENALIYLSRDNYDTLDRELKQHYQISIADLTGEKEPAIKVHVRKPALGKLKYKQISARYKIVKKITPQIKNALRQFDFSNYKNDYAYDDNVVVGKIGKGGLTAEIVAPYSPRRPGEFFSFAEFLHLLVQHCYGLLNESELMGEFSMELNQIHQSMESNAQWLMLNPHLDGEDIVRNIAASFMNRVEYAKEVIQHETEIDLLEWQGGEHALTLKSPNGAVYKFMPKFDKQEAHLYQRHPQDFLDDNFSHDNNADPQDMSYNYAPYKMDSAFEQNALGEMLKLSELENLEVYFNGYKDARLESFWIQTPRGRYTPDFLVLKRQHGKKYAKGGATAIEKVIIIETKGKPYYNEEFKAKEQFIKGDFLRHNPHFTYHCFVDDDKNDFTRHLHAFRQLLAGF